MIDADEAVKVHRDYHKMQANRENNLLEHSISKKGIGYVMPKDPKVVDAWLELWKPVWEGLGYKVVHNPDYPTYSLTGIVVVYPPALGNTRHVTNVLPLSEEQEKENKILTKTDWFIIMSLVVALVVLLLS